MLGKLWQKAARVILAVAVVLAFLLVIEFIRAYQTLYDLHPVAGYLFLAGAAIFIAWGIGRLLGGWRLRPRTLKPPDVGDLDAAELADLRRYGRYLARYLDRLALNESLDEDQRRQAARDARELSASVARCGSRDEMLPLLRSGEAEHVEPLLAVLDARAEREIGDCVRDVMVGVAASPWPLLDAAIVLYRNGGMVTRVTHIYNSRPPVREQLVIFVDTIRLVATIKIAHMMRKILERTVRDVPLAGRIAEALTQAVGAGLLTSVAGHACKHRCRAFRGWNQAQAAQDLKARLGDFLKDCWNIASESLLGPLGKLYHHSVDKIGSAFRAAVEATGKAADTYVRQPVASGGRQVAAGIRRSARGLFRRRK